MRKPDYVNEQRRALARARDSIERGRASGRLTPEELRRRELAYSIASHQLASFLESPR